MTFKFSDHSLLQLKTLHPDLQTICSYVIQRHDFRIDVGHRGESDQNEAFRAGKSKLKFPQSKHNSNPSHAMDLLPFVGGKFIGWLELGQWRFFAGRVLGTADMLYTMGEIGHRLRWGGDWDGDNDMRDNTFNDLPHFELLTPTKG